MKNLLFSLALMAVCFTTQAQQNTLEPDLIALEKVMKAYKQDCYGDSTKVDIHKPMDAKEVQAEPCVYERKYNTNGTLTETCLVGRHHDVGYQHVDWRSFERFALWLEQKQSENVVETVKKE